jgi:hypothetical protein
MKALAVLGAIALMLATPAFAGIVFSNPPDYVEGDCSFSTTCAAEAGRGDDFGAQEFTLSAAEVLTGASFTDVAEFDSTQPSAANWIFLAADGAGGLPGTVLFQGSGAPITARVTLDADSGGVEEDFALPSVALGAGTYYFAIQAVSSDFSTYLALGQLGAGAAETHDGGATWVYGYGEDDQPSVAVSLSNGGAAVPEPASWMLMLAGFGLLGGAIRKRR